MDFALADWHSASDSVHYIFDEGLYMIRAIDNPSTSEMPTVSGVIRVLYEQGYTQDFNLDRTGFFYPKLNKKIFPIDFEIDQTYRFEGDSDPSDEAVVYAVSIPKYGLKGILVNGYNIYSDPLMAEFAKKFQEGNNRDTRFKRS